MREKIVCVSGFVIVVAISFWLFWTAYEAYRYEVTPMSGQGYMILRRDRYTGHIEVCTPGAAAQCFAYPSR